jgi:RimJ/RimL family protein N-acetyltransferase
MLTTARLHLRPTDPSDLPFVFDLHSLPESDEFNTLGIPENIKVTEAHLNEWHKAHQADKIKSYVFVIEKKETSIPIGLFGLNLGKEKYKNAEVWYLIHPTFWRQGFATEALSAILDFGFDQLILHRIEAGCAIENIGSIKVLEKVGMKREGRKRQILPLKTGWSDNFIYAILSTDKRTLVR